MKRKLTGLLLILTMLTTLLPAGGAFAATDVCTESPDGQHHWEHFNAADCENGGMEYWQCTYCYDWQDDGRWIDALGHAWSEWTVRSEPACLQPRTEYRECSRCGKSETRETAALGHAWDNGTVTKAQLFPLSLYYAEEKVRIFGY